MAGQVALILLAAGGSTRMGTPKQLLPFRDVTLLRHAAQIATKTTCKPIVAVLGDRAEQCRKELEGLPIDTVVNPIWERGMGSSLRAGIEHALKIDPTVEAVLIHLCDQAAIDSTALESLVTAYRQSHRPLIASEFDGTIGSPAIIGGLYLQKLRQSRDDQAGAKPILLQADPGDILSIPLPAAAIDIDTLDQYRALHQPQSE